MVGEISYTDKGGADGSIKQHYSAEFKREAVRLMTLPQAVLPLRVGGWLPPYEVGDLLVPGNTQSSDFAAVVVFLLGVYRSKLGYTGLYDVYAVSNIHGRGCSWP